MVFLDLILKVISENLKELRLDEAEFHWYFVIQCTQCKDDHSNEIYFSLNDEVEMTKGHGSANFIMACKSCKMTMSIAVHKKSKLVISCENGNNEETFASFDCRGCELKKWIPKEGIILESLESGNCFENVDINDIWCEYDDDAKVNCSLLEPVEYRFQKNKNF